MLFAVNNSCVLNKQILTSLNQRFYLLFTVVSLIETLLHVHKFRDVYVSAILVVLRIAYLFNCEYCKVFTMLVF